MCISPTGKGEAETEGRQVSEVLEQNRYEEDILQTCRPDNSDVAVRGCGQPGPEGARAQVDSSTTSVGKMGSGRPGSSPARAAAASRSSAAFSSSSFN